ncbi:MAG TPA: NYN domain-containing protein [Candidatus Goldiibacteriota bacterium]|nr:NYN domain-containing protein [Candidatus Goldiibacteriota bacterium]HPI02678.1 NYN domain-containing protein [Candidatus Goldiibacteriota bacterium]HPN64426.1 NYN domain-containing protein [Candidatus Goldiibacteriota bacterium]HRQ44797.1 NYN domain-containing protein [Candidatus Goldiibacteriota bacterium]
MKIIIDGYNLMYRVRFKGVTLEQKREEMMDMIKEFLALNPNDVTVVFDASRSISNHRGHQRFGEIKAVFSGPGESADDIIEEMIRNRTGKAREHMVVSSDNRLIKYALEHHFKTMTSDEFAEYLEQE